MLKIDIDNGRVEIRGNGNLPEICENLVRIVKELKNNFSSDEDASFLFETFLKDIFIDLVFADGEDEMTAVLLDALRRHLSDGETEHKQD